MSVGSLCSPFAFRLHRAVMFAGACILASVGWAEAPIEELRRDVDWLCPLVVESPYEGLRAGDVIELGEGVINLDGLRRQDVDNGSLAVLYYDEQKGAWQRPGQALLAPLPFRPFAHKGAIYFRLTRDVAPLAVDDDYVLVSARPAQLARWPAVGKPVEIESRFRLTRSQEDVAKGWNVIPAQKARASVHEARDPRRVRVDYVGSKRSDQVRVTGPTMPVPPGETVMLRVVYRVADIPQPTMDSLPGPEHISRPGQAEGRIPRVVWGLDWRDRDGRPVKGPSPWMMNRMAMSQPLSRVNVLKVPKAAAAVQVRFTLGGMGRIRFDILDVCVDEMSDAPTRARYDIYAAGKVIFPQLEWRRSGKPFRLRPQETVWLAPSLRSLDEAQRPVLLDGLRGARVSPVERGPSEGHRIVAGLLSDGLARPTEVARDRVLAQRVKALPAEGYVLDVSSSRALVLGRDIRGVFYGLQELGERLRLASSVRSALIIDWPELPLRMVHHHLTWQRVKRPKEYYTRWIPILARLRINAIAFDVRGDWYRLLDKSVREHWEWVFGFCRRWHVDPVPMGFNFRNQMPVRESSHWVASKWVEDEAYTLPGQTPVRLKPKPDAFYHRPRKPGSSLVADEHGNTPVIPMLKAGNPVLVESQDRGTIYERGRDYVISGKIAWGGHRLPFTWLNLREPYTIRRTAGSRIPDGATVLLSYNYLYRQRGWHNETYSTCISEPAARALNRRALADVVRILQPKLIHLNQDEVVGIGRDGRDRMCMREKKLTPGGLFADLLKDLRSAVREAGSDAELVVWHDGLTPLHGGWMLTYNGPHYTFDAVDHLAKDFVVNVWGYGRAPGKQRQMSEYFQSRGFPVVGSPAETGPREGVIDWCRLLSTLRLGCPERVKGVFLSSWRDPNKVTFRWRRDLARLAWNAAPWTRVDGDAVRIYDPYDRPTEARIGDRPLKLKPARHQPDDWEAWKAGYVMCAELSAEAPLSGSMHVTTESGLASRHWFRRARLRQGSRGDTGLPK